MTTSVSVTTPVDVTAIAGVSRLRASAAFWAAVAGLVALTWAWFLGRDLFVLAEARGFSLNRPPIDPARFLLLPELGWGNGRLLGIAFYQGTGTVCGVDPGCFTLVGALLTAVVTIMAVLVGARITRSLPVALGAVAVWLASPTFVGISLWQGTWFELLVFGLVLATVGAWWEALGRPGIGRATAVAFVAGSLLVLALAFNAKETAYGLLLVLPVIAVVRGAGRPGGVRRNLLLSAVPVTYGLWFVTWGVTHMDAAYAAKELQEGFLGGLDGMLTAMSAQGDEFMYVPQLVTDGDRLQGLAAVFGVAAAALVIGLLAVGAWHAFRHREARGKADRPSLLVAWGGELVLGAMLVATTLILSPSRAPTAYYLSLPVWSAAALLLCLLRRAAAQVPRGRVLATAALGAWIAAQAITLASLLLPGSTWAQLVVASGRMRDVGSELRTLLADRAGGPVIWRTLGVPPTSFFVLRDPGQGPRDASEAYPAGGDLLPYLLEDPTARRRFTSLQGITLEEIASGAVPETAGERTTTVVIDSDYRLMLVLYEGQPILPAPGDRAAAPVGG